MTAPLDEPFFDGCDGGAIAAAKTGAEIVGSGCCCGNAVLESGACVPAACAAAAGGIGWPGDAGVLAVVEARAAGEPTAAAGCGAATPDTATVAITVPCETRSPTWTRTSRITPPASAGTSIVALSDSSSTSAASLAIVSPALTKTVMTGIFSKSPMSGTTRSIVLSADIGTAGVSAESDVVNSAASLPPPATGISAPAAAETGVLGTAGIVAGASSATSTLAKTLPCDTRSPIFTRTSRTVPAADAGTSIVALSDSSVTSGASLPIASPAAMRISMIGTSSKPPISGTVSSIVLAMQFSVLIPSADSAFADRCRTSRSLGRRARAGRVRLRLVRVVQQRRPNSGRPRKTTAASPARRCARTRPFPAHETDGRRYGRTCSVNMRM